MRGLTTRILALQPPHRNCQSARRHRQKSNTNTKLSTKGADALGRKSSKEAPASKMAIECYLETVNSMVFKSKMDLSGFNFYVARIVIDVGEPSTFTFNEDIWDGELSWSFYGEPDEFTLSVDGDLRLEIKSELADVFNGIAVAKIVLEVEFRVDGDSPPLGRSSYQILEKGTFRLLNLRTSELTD
ncbi:hypothetical protein [Nevskia ramosa]|uniref:hypothetical protein n=1 Tax=Nevskia ramosa TaxID=64002 RepID=UPI003D0D5104